jgi:hypothetical protein
MMRKLLFTLIVPATIITAVRAQVNYTPVSPSVTLTATYASESYNIDFNEDGVIDVIISADKEDVNPSGFMLTLTGCAIFTPGGSEVAGYPKPLGDETILLADSVSNLETIGPDLIYISSSTPALFPGIGLSIIGQMAGTTTTLSTDGEFIGKQKYIGVKFMIGTAVHYGWVLVNCSANFETVTILGYAYDETADEPILAGDMGSAGVVSVAEQTRKTNVYAHQGKMYVQTEAALQVDIFNILGAKVAEHNAINGSVIDLSNLKSGVYVVSYGSGVNKTTRKFVIE